MSGIFDSLRTQVQEIAKSAADKVAAEARRQPEERFRRALRDLTVMPESAFREQVAKDSTETAVEWKPVTEFRPTVEVPPKAAEPTSDLLGQLTTRRQSSLTDNLPDQVEMAGPIQMEKVRADEKVERPELKRDRLQKPAKRRSYRLTWGQYEALTPAQKAGVDFNTMLIQAREKDLNTDYNPSPEQKESYDALVTEILGEGNGSTIHAPETVKLLKQMGFKHDKADLDDILNMRYAFGEKMIDKMADLDDVSNIHYSFNDKVIDRVPSRFRPVAEAYVSSGRPGAEAYVSSGRSIREALATGAVELQKKLAEKNRLYQNLETSMRASRAPGIREIGGRPGKPVRLQLGFDNKAAAQKYTIDEYFRKALEGLAQVGAHEKLGVTEEQWRDAALQEIASKLTDEEIDAFYRYADDISRNAERLGRPLGNVPGVEYRKPEEFRALLKLDSPRRKKDKE